MDTTGAMHQAARNERFYNIPALLPPSPRPPEQDGLSSLGEHFIAQLSFQNSRPFIRKEGRGVGRMESGVGERVFLWVFPELNYPNRELDFVGKASPQRPSSPEEPGSGFSELVNYTKLRYGPFHRVSLCHFVFRYLFYQLESP